MSTLLETPFYSCHLANNAKMVDFAGWALPVHYGSLTEEHLCVRKDSGMFDVSHMTIVDLYGGGVKEYLRTLLANDVSVLKEQGKALYSCMLNENGGVIDDLICYFFDDNHYRLIVNAATSKKDLAWLDKKAKEFDVRIEEQPQLAMLAIQGPDAIEKANKALTTVGFDVPKLKRFQGAMGDNIMIARTGYTGEDGYEVAVNPNYATELWDALIDEGVRPCGLGARDTLRLEAGMALYGNDLSEEYTPIESGLKWTINTKDAERQFIGKSTIVEQLDNGAPHQMLGVVLEERGVLREQQIIKSNDDEIGILTSGGYSPSLERSIGLARVKSGEHKDLKVVIRNKELSLRTVPYPFYREGASTL